MIILIPLVIDDRTKPMDKSTKKFKYRCMRCNETKNDQGRWVRYLRHQCKVCQSCANILRGKK
jgi:hypothetical protein